MTKSMLFFIAVLIVALGARPVLAGDEKPLVAVTDPTPPNIGVTGMHDLCKAQFPGTHWCSSWDIIRKGALAGALPPSAAWVHPDIRGDTAEGGDGDVQVSLDASGNVGESTGRSMTCNLWRSQTPAQRGLTITSAGNLEVTNCFIPRPVACCGEPVNLPEIFIAPGPTIGPR